MVRVSAGSGFGEKVFSILDGWGGEALEHVVPFFDWRLAEAFPPTPRDFETPAPIRQLEGRVHGLVFRKSFLRALQGRAEDVALTGFIPKCIRRHEFGGLGNDFREL